MSEEETGTQSENSPPINGRNARKRRFLNRRTGLLAASVVAVAVLLFAMIAAVSYRYGFLDSYIKNQFIEKMNYMGIDFDASVFRVTASPLQLELKEATFNDRTSGEKLFYVRDARLGLTIQNLFAWQLSRDITVDSTEINGAEAWIKFDENGRSNFSNLIEDDRTSNLNLNYSSVKFSLRDSVAHFGDISRSMTADAKNVQLMLEPENISVPDDQKRYKIDITSTDSQFVYDGNALQEINIRASGIADRNGADITELKIETPVGVSYLNGRISDWETLKYDLNIESSVDLTQTSNIFPLGATLRGVGNFKGKVTGQGEIYRVDGRVESDSIAADGIYLKAVNVAATVEGTNSNYEANGNAVAELLTFEDFRIEFPKIAGNVRGTGTDFRWLGELQAVAAKSKSLTLGGLFLSDAVAEYKDKQLSASAGSGVAKKFSIGDTEFADLAARNLKIVNRDGTTGISAPTAAATSLKTNDYRLDGLTGRSLSVKTTDDRTTVDIAGLSARNATLKNNKASNLRADSFALNNRREGTDIRLQNMTADRVDADGTIITGVSAPSVEITDRGSDTKIYSDNMRVASIAAEGAVLGSLNIAGVRLTIREGRVEGTSNDIDAGNVALVKNSAIPEGGTLEGVKIVKPVFVVEPSGRYRASADMSIGGGIVGSIPLGSASAKMNLNNDRVELNDLNAIVMSGQMIGRATIGLNSRNDSLIVVDFTNLDLSKVLALQGGLVLPIEGQTTGQANLTFKGTEIKTIGGTISADITANAGTTEKGLVPINGNVELSAQNGLFNVDLAKLNSEKSELSATGRFDLRNEDSNLKITLNSSDASEVDRLVRVLGFAPDVEQQLDSMRAEFAGGLKFDGMLTGNLTDPTVRGKAALDSISLRGREVGSVSTDIFVSPVGVEMQNGMLSERDGGEVAFSLNIPYGGANNTSILAKLNGVNAGNLLAALPIELPERIRDFNGKTSGTVNLIGLPNESQGFIELASTSGTIAGQVFDSLNAKAVFAGTRIELLTGEIRLGEGYLSAKGVYDRASTAFNFDVAGKNVPLPLALSFLPPSENVPAINGVADFTAKATGETERVSSYDIAFSGSAREVVVNENSFGAVDFRGVTQNQILTADLTAILDNRPQIINASVNFANEDIPFRVETGFDQSPLAPFFALVPQLRGISIGGTGTGRVEFGGNLSQIGPDGKRVFTSENLTGTAQFSQLALLIQDTPLVAVEPVSVRFNPQEIVFESARFSGGGSNLTIAGTKAITDDGMNNLSVDGRVNLGLLNVFPGVSASDTFFAGYSDVAIRLTGVNKGRLTGTATFVNATIATFIGSDRLTFDRMEGQVFFSANQAQFDRVTGYLGGGKFVAVGGALIGDNLTLDSFRLGLTGTNITVPLPKDFITTGDAPRIEVTGRRIGGNLSVLIAGNIIAKRSVYNRDIDLANVVGARREGSLSSGASSGFAPSFDLTIDGRDALVIRNNIADLTASASLRLTGNTDNPQLSGRITANSGTVFFRKDRYIVQRGVLEFPPNTEIEPIIYLQAESEIKGYQVFVNLSGSLTDTELLSATVRSSPALPQADIISLITTGNLSNTESGIPTFASTGINTAAEILTDSIINNPARKATDKLFGLNVFEIDPIISGERLNPSARLTVGRQINNNLRVTYATNLSQDQNQVLALEYRVSNKLSVVAQYEQRSLSNVTSNRDNFSFEVRFRRRF
ncbi:MAG: translocation/assembly module TamB domain-containing protein [Blastocatellia bacterium]